MKHMLTVAFMSLVALLALSIALGATTGALFSSASVLALVCLVAFLAVTAFAGLGIAIAVLLAWRRADLEQRGVGSVTLAIPPPYSRAVAWPAALPSLPSQAVEPLSPALPAPAARPARFAVRRRRARRAPGNAAAWTFHFIAGMPRRERIGR